jgi:GNAT superfamily N-acetyltransferase
VIEVLDDLQILTVAELAREIWVEHYTSIIGAAQVEYMLERFQSVEAIARQIREEGYCYFLIEGGQRPSGYFGIQVMDATLFLSKFYVLASERGKGYGKRAMAFIEQLARDAGCSEITLTVNKNNKDSVAAYERMGFKIDKSIVQDIGNGFVMDDYLMEKSI